MRFRPRRKLTRRNLFFILLLLSGLMLLLPARFTGKLLNLAQVEVPLASGASRAVDAAAKLVDGNDPPISAAEARALATRMAALQHQLTAQAARIDQLETQNRALTGIRSRGLTAHGRLIPARVLAWDALDWRDSRWIGRGSSRGVRGGQAVVSGTMHLALGAADGARDGLSVLASEVLIGVVHQTAAFTSQVRLLSDPATRMRVVIGRPSDSGANLLDASFWLVGAGHGRMQVRDVDRRYLEDGRIKLGDTVLSPPDDADLPAALTIGTITGIENDHANGLLRILEVTPPIELASARQVFVVDLGGS